MMQYEAVEKEFMVELRLWLHHGLLRKLLLLSSSTTPASPVTWQIFWKASRSPTESVNLAISRWIIAKPPDELAAKLLRGSAERNTQAATFSDKLLGTLSLREEWLTRQTTE
jgi:hypothetical protein